LKLTRIDRFTDAVVSTGLKPGHQPFLIGRSHQRDDVSELRRVKRTNGTDGFGTVDFRHHPVKQNHFGAFFVLKMLRGGDTISNYDNVMAPLFQTGLKNLAGNDIMLCNQNSHEIPHTISQTHL
jgi:hypothetical protein